MSKLRWSLHDPWMLLELQLFTAMFTYAMLERMTLQDVQALIPRFCHCGTWYEIIAFSEVLGYELYLFIYFLILFLNFTILYGSAIYRNESATVIHVFPILNPPPSPYHPSGSSQCTSPKHPVSCIKPGLATRFIYDIMHISMPFSQIIPPSPSLTESKRLFYKSVSLLLSHIQGYRYHLSKFHIICVSKLYWCFSFWLASLSIFVK